MPTRRKTIEEHIVNFKIVHGETHYDYSESEYINCKTKIKIWCNVHKEFFYQTIHDHKSGYGCYKCGIDSIIKRFTKTFVEFVQDARKFHGNDYEYFEEYYVNRTTKTKILCNACGNMFEITPSSHIAGTSCRCKTESRGERKIRNYLTECNIDFKCQYTNDECKNINHLPFDFALFKYGKLIGIIEFQGRQHFEVVNFGRNKEDNIKNFELTQHRDKIKQEWCDKNDIPFFPIRYDRKKLLMWVKVAINMCFQKEDIYEKIEKQKPENIERSSPRP